jgi:DNA-3-methyladenine glycosylase II
MPASLSCQIELPARFRGDTILPFHQRDAQQQAERVDGGCLRKGLLWHGQPACLELRIADGHAVAGLAIDGMARADDDERLEAMARRMLGLTQAIADFERQYATHPELGALIARQAGLRVPQTATPFEALAWAITGQQISVAVAVSLRRRLIAAAGLRHTGSGLYCHPEAQQVAALGEDSLRGCGFSAGKTRALLTVSRLQAAGELPLDDWLAHPSPGALRERLAAIKGIGPWTIGYTLLRGYAWLDGSLHGDVAVRRALGQLRGNDAMPSEAETRSWLEAFTPWRALVAAHLWASLQLSA